MTALGSVEGEAQRPDAASDDVDEQPGVRRPASSGQPREPLSTRAIASIAATVIAALITVGGLAAVAAFDTLRDDIGVLRAENREQFAEIDTILRDHTERLTRVETRQQLHTEQLHDHTERFTRIEARLQDHSKRFTRIEAQLQDHTERFTRIEAQLQDHTERLPDLTERLTRIEAGLVR